MWKMSSRTVPIIIDALGSILSDIFSLSKVWWPQCAEVYSSEYGSYIKKALNHLEFLCMSKLLLILVPVLL